MPWTFYVFITSSLAAGLYSVVLLVVGRNVGETWDNFQLLYLRLVVLGRHLGDRVAHVSAAMFVYALSPYDEWHRLAWAGALVLIVLIIASVALVRYVVSRGTLKGAS